MATIPADELSRQNSIEVALTTNQKLLDPLATFTTEIPSQQMPSYRFDRIKNNIKGTVARDCWPLVFS